MATTASGKKSIRQAEKRRVFNVRRVRAMKQAVKQVDTFVKNNDKQGAADLLKTAQKAIDKAAKSGIIKKNAAARKKSRLSRSVAKIS